MIDWFFILSIPLTILLACYVSGYLLSVLMHDKQASREREFWQREGERYRERYWFKEDDDD